MYKSDSIKDIGIFGIPTFLSKSDTAPFDLNMIRREINAHYSDEDEFISSILLEACKEVEEDFNICILETQFELLHQRPDIYLYYNPVRSVDKVQVKIGRDWRDIDEHNFEIEGLPPEKYIIGTLGSFIGQTVRINNWKDEQQIKITFTAGYRLGDTEIKYSIPTSIKRSVIRYCWKKYNTIDIEDNRYSKKSSDRKSANSKYAKDYVCEMC